MFKLFKKSESGATLVEYGVAVILAIIVGGGFLSTLATQTTNSVDCGTTKLTARAANPDPACS